MSKTTLVVGALSTWSMRAWMCLKIAEIEFNEVVIPLGQTAYQSRLDQFSDTRLVPVLLHGKTKIHDSLAIAEYVNEIAMHPIWPESPHERAIARSLCAELHSGFSAIRADRPFHLDANRDIAMSEAIKFEVRRLTQSWKAAAGTFYFKDVSIVDAFYSVMAYRLASYGIKLPGKAGEYQSSLIRWPLFQSALQKTQRWNQTAK